MSIRKKVGLSPTTIFLFGGQSPPYKITQLIY